MKPTKRTTKVVVVTSVMLSFISFWRATAIVLNDLDSSAFYGGGIEQGRGQDYEQNDRDNQDHEHHR